MEKGCNPLIQKKLINKYLHMHMLYIFSVLKKEEKR